jgi:hypothetical protein
MHHLIHSSLWTDPALEKASILICRTLESSTNLTGTNLEPDSCSVEKGFSNTRATDRMDPEIYFKFPEQ